MKSLPEARSRPRKDRGIAVVTAIGIALLVGILAVALVAYNFTQTGITRWGKSKRRAFNAAEAGINYGIQQLSYSSSGFPETTDTTGPSWILLPNNTGFKSGLPDEPPQPIELESMNQIYPGYSTKHTFNRYHIVASGIDMNTGITSVIEVRVKLGPIPSGTSY